MLDGVDTAMFTLPVKVNGSDYHLAIIAPQFPEWYVYTNGPDALPDATRVMVLDATRKMAAEIMPDSSRLKKEEVEPMFNLVIQHILGPLRERARTDEQAKQIFEGFSGLYSICGLDIKSRGILSLPPYYKELSIFWIDTLFNPSNIPQLRQLVHENT